MSDIWVKFRQATQARIGLNRKGHSISTGDLLAFQLAHAAARDAVQSRWEVPKIAGLHVQSMAHTRDEYLKNPGLGRKLSEESTEILRNVSTQNSPEIVVIVTDGLSAKAVEAHFEKFWECVMAKLQARGFAKPPLVFVPFARVAISDDIGYAMGSRLAVIFVGERPGLTSADSLGIYLTYDPKPGNSDANRNCISNVRPPNGLSYDEAADKLVFLVEESLRRKISGVELKEAAHLHIIR